MENNLNKYKEFKLTLEVIEHNEDNKYQTLEYCKQNTFLLTKEHFKDLINNKSYLHNALNSMLLAIFTDCIEQFENDEYKKCLRDIKEVYSETSNKKSNI